METLDEAFIKWLKDLSDEEIGKMAKEFCKEE